MGDRPKYTTLETLTLSIALGWGFTGTIDIQSNAHLAAYDFAFSALFSFLYLLFVAHAHRKKEKS